MRSYAISYPSRVHIGKMNNLYQYEGDSDVAIHVEPTEERFAIDELTAQITKYETQMQLDNSGSTRNSTSTPAKLKALYEQRAKLEQNYEDMFRVTTAFTVYNTDRKELEKETQKLTAKLSGDRLHITPLTLREDDGLKTVSPFGTNLVPDYYRNMNTGALSALFPFYYPEVCNENGTLIGINRDRSTATILNLFNKKEYGNANILISGKSGAGKTIITSLLTLRGVAESIRSVIIDIENEYGPCTDAVDGPTIKIAPGSAAMMNPLDIDEEFRLDRNGEPTDEKYVDIKGKVAEVLNLFCIMVPECGEGSAKAEISDILMKMYADFGITESPDSLYETKKNFNAETGEYFSGRVLKTMPRISDFHIRLKKRVEELGDDTLKNIERSFRIYCEGGLYDLFDCYTTVSQNVFQTAPIIRFDVSGIEDKVLRPIGMYIVTNWTWNKFIKKDKKTKKRIVSDETWVLLSESNKGSEFTASFLENCARRIRKYNGSLCCASQNFREFVARKEGEAILTNTAVKILLAQEETDINAVGDKFILSTGEREFLLTAGRGETLMKIGKESFLIDVIMFPFEYQMLAKEKEQDKKGGTA